MVAGCETLKVEQGPVCLKFRELQLASQKLIKSRLDHCAWRDVRLRSTRIPVVRHVKVG